MIILICGSLVLAIVREFTIFNIIIRGTSNIHYAMSKRIVRAQIVFFDSNPIGRILTRFSKDMVVLDLIIPFVAVLVSYGIFRTAAITIALCIVNYWLLIPLVVVLVYFVYLMNRASQAMI